MSDEQPVKHLSERECYAFLTPRRFGRMATAFAKEPQIFPVNYVLDMDPEGTASNPILYIRSAPGDKLLAAATHQPVAFEVDDIRTSSATSVVVAGTARIVSSDAEEARVDELGLQPWIATLKTEVIAIDVTGITGREFTFGPEPDVASIEPTA